MPVLEAIAAALAWLGRQGTRAIAASIFVGIALPQLAVVCKPIIPESIFVLLCLAFLRVDPSALRGYFQRPALVLAGSAWLMLATPAISGAVLYLSGLRKAEIGLFLGMMLQAVAPPIMSFPAFAALMGLDAALSLAVLIVSIVVTPLTAAFFAHIFAGPALPLSATSLGVKLMLILAGSALVAYAIRRFAGREWVEAQRERIDGVNVILLFVFAIAVLEDFAPVLLSKPLRIIGLIVFSFVLTFVQIAAAMLVLARAGRAKSFAIGVGCGTRNMGLMLAATSSVLPDMTWLYFGLAQFPIYLAPHFLKPLAQRFTREHGET
jgi:BASS family bile acid:Na+ symporter